MHGSRTIHVVKRDGTRELLDRRKLRLSLWRAMQHHGSHFSQAECLSQAVQTYLTRSRCRTVSSRALFEMVVRVLRQTGHEPAAETLERHQRQRSAARRRVYVLDSAGRRRPWSRSWVAREVMQRWALSHAAGRAISAEVERQVLTDGTGHASRQLSADHVLDRADQLVEEFGLAPWCLLASVPTE